MNSHVIDASTSSRVCKDESTLEKGITILHGIIEECVVCLVLFRVVIEFFLFQNCISSLQSSYRVAHARKHIRYISVLSLKYVKG